MLKPTLSQYLRTYTGDEKLLLSSLLTTPLKDRFPVLRCKVNYLCTECNKELSKKYLDVIINHLDFNHGWKATKIADYVESIEKERGVKPTIDDSWQFADSSQSVEKLLARYPLAQTDYRYFVLKYWQVFNGLPIKAEEWYKKLAQIQTLERLRRKHYESGPKKSQLKMFKEK